MRTIQKWQLLPLSLALAVATLAGCDDNDDAPAPAAQTETPLPVSGPDNPVLLGLTDERKLVQFRANTPGTVVGSPLSLTGPVIDDENNPPGVVSMDFRPSSGQLYVLFNDNRLYTANLSSGALTLVGRSSVPDGTSTLDSIDFNPVADLIRAASDLPDRGQVRIRPTDGSLAGTDTPMAYVTGDANASNTPAIEGVAYTGAGGAGSKTTAYVLDATQDVLAMLGGPDGAPDSPNTGKLTTIGAFGTFIGGGGGVGFDIPTGPTTIGFVSDGSTGAGGADSTIYSINLTTGVLTSLGTVTGQRLVGLAIVPGTGVSTGTPPPGAAPPPAGTVGLAPGDGLCDVALAGPGFTPAVTLPGSTDPCLPGNCTISNEGNLVDPDFENFATASTTGILFAGPTVTVTGADPVTFGPGIAGAVFSIANDPDGDLPGQLAVAPGMTIATLMDGVATGESDSADFDVIGSFMGEGLVAGDKFAATITTTKPFDAIEVTFNGGLIGLNTTINMHYACAQAPVAGTIPGLPL